mmetsp:Transcript_26482/g.40033  ORF Transcript_26482/g.40033 Transcript_26482/m.40033 type:complete len:81 (+) Transcript_26482:788-1030(+)
MLLSRRQPAKKGVRDISCIDIWTVHVTIIIDHTDRLQGAFFVGVDSPFILLHLAAACREVCFVDSWLQETFLRESLGQAV